MQHSTLLFPYFAVSNYCCLVLAFATSWIITGQCCIALSSRQYILFLCNSMNLNVEVSIHNDDCIVQYMDMKSVIVCSN